MPAGLPKEPLPRWDLGRPYPGLDSPEYHDDKDRLTALIQNLQRENTLFREDKNPDERAYLRAYIQAYNRAAELYKLLFAYAYMHYTVETGNPAAARELEALESQALPLERAKVEFRENLGKMRGSMAELLEDQEDLRPYRSFLLEQHYLRRRQMSADMEELAAELALSGAEAWERLHQAVSASVTMEWSENEHKTLVELRSLAFHRDRRLRERAYHLELEGWKRVELPLSYALNGVKGFSISLNRRRNWSSTLEKTIYQSRMSPASFESLLLVMEEALPVFHRYYRAKARALGLEKLAFFDLFAPLGKSRASWNFSEAIDFIARQFSLFSPELGDFARQAAGDRWIDGEPRKGKVGGAYCINLGKESRILCNFDASFSSLITLAHELGHAYHHKVLKDVGPILRSYPMTLAETASTFCETIVLEQALERASREEGLQLVEQFLQDAGQVVVDILSRYRFEKKIFALRAGGRIPPEELSRIMAEAQQETYGPVLDGAYLHPYMWAVKGHYYRHDLAFYNFPYAFGLLFALGLVANYEKEGPDFAESYRKILAAAGSQSAEDTAGLAGFTLDTPNFWRQGIEKINDYVQKFEGLLDP